MWSLFQDEVFVLYVSGWGMCCIFQNEVVDNVFYISGWGYPRFFPRYWGFTDQRGCRYSEIPFLGQRGNDHSIKSFQIKEL